MIVTICKSKLVCMKYTGVIGVTDVIQVLQVLQMLQVRSLEINALKGSKTL